VLFAPLNAFDLRYVFCAGFSVRLICIGEWLEVGGLLVLLDNLPVDLHRFTLRIRHLTSAELAKMGVAPNVYVIIFVEGS
jgi:hypothetical protein